MSLKNRVVVITGASSGIGRAAALRFAAKRASLVLAARSQEELDAVAAQCRELGSDALVVATDVTDADAVQVLASRAVQRFGRIDVWVNDASVGFYSPFLDAPIEDFRRVLDVNVMGYVHGARAALGVMRAQGEGVLVNVASIAGEIAMPYASAYSMSKAAVRAMAGSLRNELRLEGVRGVKIATVLPGTVDTPFFENAANYTGRRVLAMPPVNSVDRVARAVVSAAIAPRREIAVGTGAHALVRQHRMTPKLIDGVLSAQVDRTHLSTTEPAPPTSGNLYRPSGEVAGHGTDGGWGGRRRTAVRRVLGVGLLVGGGAYLVRRWGR
ncbi:short-subunit dehydrogenase [Diaminobutyricimonas aerilata]|uniref:Short-subunit dehydrogenase n=1 Tax=Diaminobutyricimonas aerilata TaxID=1162967 RepID=A0A2M9CLZ5_9MICO|nr:SDR family oxidoreductase [Diaminobutyricimonas aerilata]PJJ72909.1 short-subunit dehydrogenase [Diaminobutyricimonas aerilata]